MFSLAWKRERKKKYLTLTETDREKKSLRTWKKNGRVRREYVYFGQITREGKKKW